MKKQPTYSPEVKERAVRLVLECELDHKSRSAAVQGGARPQTQLMVDFIDQHADEYGVEPICKQLPIAPSTYHRHKRLIEHPEQRSNRAQKNESLELEIKRVWSESYGNYGVRKVWLQLGRESISAARCTVARLMKRLGLQGVRRGRRIKTTFSSPADKKPMDLVKRDFSALRPNQL